MKTKMISTRVAMSSLVGVMCEDYPVSYGNYCGVKEGAVLNLWAENLEYLAKNKIIDDTMEAIEFGNNYKAYVVIDKRIPKDFFNKEIMLYNKGDMNEQDVLNAYYVMRKDFDKTICICKQEEPIYSIHSAYRTEISANIKHCKCYVCGREYIVQGKQKEIKEKLNVKWICESEIDSGIFYSLDTIDLLTDVANEELKK